ncbi:hypothetical protein DIU31_028535 [Mucilaginibacter rubeus]|uniref:HEPN AbiJ-N-terminal domain-containing protein n=2 Tax=Mucilaginibacter rubeus TaxID=2027860 RepID=A0AAE6JKD5_9SPHI|nr:MULTISPECIES: hypothetical protein [Mucilaginibacter]QEM07256.1 hypothetical protein DIU31_028535 [Mucilaginibacter rubeus]QEM19711.1 hypothetical protein DIU38_028110 [Mucilaginibacter gossypii]QTE43591.1 hypothetical protein J3L19_32515 [Mucilaginibacter rubeus]QTE50191.1 hypothetical protein J3L21_32470 [Mucilaginibacter rubeus]QTE65262.1 hypothetical protein J3L22_09735 [Mucilaginibacter rubeus]
MALFSDREFGKKPATNEQIEISVWNGIVSIYESYVANHSLDKDFPEQCQDGRGIIGFDPYKFNHLLKATIPEIETPISIKRAEVKPDYSDWGEPAPDVTQPKPSNETDLTETIAILDFLEFCYQHLYDAKSVGDLHDYFQHYHYSFSTREIAQAKFRTDVNYLFQRNGIAYEMNTNGEVQRLLPEEMQNIIKKNYKTNDADLNDLLNQAAEQIHMPALSDRKHGLERLWDAFERAKTYYSANKKISAQQLVNEISAGNQPFADLLTLEAGQLTTIGNQFQIRHFETDKIPLTNIQHIDYLFFRGYALINLMMKTLEK